MIESNDVVAVLTLLFDVLVVSWLIPSTKLNECNVFLDVVTATDDSGVCPICLDDFETGAVSLKRCGHSFHAVCLWKWMEIQNTCPLCRTKS